MQERVTETSPPALRDSESTIAIFAIYKAELYNFVI